ncbi:MAG TPA: nitroreductase family protein [Actinomycetota bacterium]|nr:nitroreductase family protein [Actinomycetota bacterium]
MELLQVIHKRRMVRQFAPTPVSEAVLTRILESALHAPSAGFAQGMDLVVLDRPEQIAEFWRITDPQGRKRPIPEGAPPVIVLPLADKSAYLRRYSEPDKQGLGLDAAEGWPVAYWDLDTAMAVMLMLLSAVDEGLGAWYFGIFHGEAELLQWLRVPDGCRPIGAVALGYPSPSERVLGSALSRKRRDLDHVVHRGGWTR